MMMKANRAIGRAAVLGVAFVLFSAACANPVGGSGGSGGADSSAGGPGSLSVSGVQPGGDGIQALTVFPDLSLSEVTHYRIELTDGPGSGSDQAPGQVQVVASDEDGQIGDPVVFEDLVPGGWTVVVEGFDGDEPTLGYDAAGEEPQTDGNKLVRGEQSVDIGGGAVADVSVTVALLDNSGETGTWEATFNWPENAGDYPITDVVTGYTWELVDFDMDPEDPEHVVASGDGSPGLDREFTIGGDVEPGRYFLTVQLKADDKPDPYTTVARYDELWYVYSNVTTAKIVSFSEDDFAFGGGAAFTVSLDGLELTDLEQFFNLGDNSTVQAGEEFTITADPEDGEGPMSDVTLSWRINGSFAAHEDEIEGVGSVTIDDNSLTFVPSADQAGNVVRITLVVDDGTMAYSGTHGVRVEPVDP